MYQKSSARLFGLAFAIIFIIHSVSPAQPGSPQDIHLSASSVNYQVHALYFIPSDRAGQSGAVESYQDLLRLYQDWYREQMEANGLGPKTFSLELEDDGATPRIHVLKGAKPALYYGTDPWGLITGEARQAGFKIGDNGNVWLCLYDGIVMSSNGLLSNGYAGGLGNTTGYGYSAGTAVLDSICLAFGRKTWLNDARSYGGLTVPELGPYPMVQQNTFPWYLGDTLSQLASSFYGIPLHELSHTFALAHDFRNDQNCSGGLMGNGHRGMRGWVEPDRYPNEGVRLSHGDALAINVNRYFNSGQNWDDNTLPTVTCLATGQLTPVNGLVEIPFQASDNKQLAVALLRLTNGAGLNTIDEFPLTGAQQNGTFRTPFYEPGKSNKFMISVFDSQGNRDEITMDLFVKSVANRAPLPSIHIAPMRAVTGQPVELDAGWSLDPDGYVINIRVEWDLDGNGVFDTPPTTQRTLRHVFTKPGNYLLRARVTDLAGASAVSAPIGIKISEPPPQNSVRAWRLYER